MNRAQLEFIKTMDRKTKRIQSLLTVEASSSQRREVLDILASLVNPTEVLPGCLGCQILQHAEDGNRITLVEEWRSEEDLRRHVQSESYRRILAVLEMSSREPEIRFSSIDEMRGMELIQEWRS